MKRPSRSAIEIFSCPRAFVLLDEVVELAPALCTFDQTAWLGDALALALTGQVIGYATEADGGDDRGERAWFNTVLSDAQLQVAEWLRDSFEETGYIDPRAIMLITDFAFLYSTKSIVVRYLHQ